MPQKFYIDTHKGITFLIVLVFIAYFNQWNNPTAMIYLALHGTYGLLWVLKSRFFPDQQWQQKSSIWYGLYIWAGLSMYWASPYIIASRSVQAPAWLLAISISMFSFGVFFHFASDMQKYIELKYNPGHLITDGLMRKVRNMNYFGEFLIYLGFSLLPMHWLPLLVMLVFIVIIWIPNMIKKDRSLARYPNFAEYKKSSKFIIPFIF
ncbi:MAG: DUF1295 domain-containing protein [Chloroflexota bacterium]